MFTVRHGSLDWTTLDPFPNGQEPGILLRDEFYCSILKGAHGKHRLLFGNALWEACRKEHEKAPHPPRIQRIFQQAYDLKARLDSTPGLTQSSLARELGINRVRVTQILNLLKLAPEIQQYILALPPSRSKNPITEHTLRCLVGNIDHEAQTLKFSQLLNIQSDSLSATV